MANEVKSVPAVKPEVKVEIKLPSTDGVKTPSQESAGSVATPPVVPPAAAPELKLDVAPVKAPEAAPAAQLALWSGFDIATPPKHLRQKVSKDDSGNVKTVALSLPGRKDFAREVGLTLKKADREQLTVELRKVSDTLKHEAVKTAVVISQSNEWTGASTRVSKRADGTRRVSISFDEVGAVGQVVDMETALRTIIREKLNNGMSQDAVVQMLLKAEAAEKAAVNVTATVTPVPEATPSI